jgi:outer membrane lipoprotein-sorting protein
MTIRRFQRLLVLALIASVAAAGFLIAAQADAAPALTAADKVELKRIETYLNGIKTMKARFLQVSSSGDYSEGTLYFAKPGKMRLEYDDPKPILIVADGVYLTYFDKLLKQISYFSLESTQASILLKEHISFSSSEILVTAFERGAGVLRLTVIKGTDPREGSLTLIFSDRPLDLKKWTVTDAQGVVTNVSLLAPRFDLPVDPNLFKFEPPPDAIHAN